MGRKARRSEPPKKKKDAAPSIAIAPSPGPHWLRVALGIAGALYIACVLIEAMPNAPRARGSGRRLHLYDVVPRPVLYFTQIAKLFPQAATYRTEYRAEGLPCDGPAFELDVRPFFPIHSDDKESRFDRALHFYRQDRPTMEALEQYIVDRYNQSGARKIEGIMLLSLRVPIPTPGIPFPRYERAPLEDFPKEQRKVWYATSRDVVDQRCREVKP